MSDFSSPHLKCNHCGIGFIQDDGGPNCDCHEPLNIPAHCYKCGCDDLRTEIFPQDRRDARFVAEDEEYKVCEACGTVQE